MKYKLLTSLAGLFIFFSCNTALDMEAKQKPKKIEVSNKLMPNQSNDGKRALHMDTVNSKLHKAKKFKLKINDKEELSLKIKSMSSFEEIFPMMVQVTLPSGDKLTYRNIVEPISKISGTLIRAYKNFSKLTFSRRCEKNRKNALEASSHSTFRLHSYKKGDITKFYSLSKTKDQYYWTLSHQKEVYGGKLEINHTDHIITKFKLDDFPKSENYYFRKNKSLLEDYLIENNVLLPNHLAQSLVKTTKDSDNKSFESAQNFRLIKRKNSGRRFLGASISFPMTAQITHELLTFYSLKENEKDSPLSCVLPLILFSPLHQNQELKYLNSITGEEQTLNIKVTKGIIDKNSIPFIKELEITQKSSKQEDLNSFTLSLDY